MKRILIALFFVLSIALPAFANFPMVQSVTQSTKGNDINFEISYPATVNPGDLILIFVSNIFDITGTSTPPTDYALIAQDDDGDNNRWWIFAKAAAGTEDGSTITFTSGDAGIWTAQMYRITGWRNSGTPANDIEVTSLFAGTTEANPPALNPTNWDIEDTLWLVMATEDINDYDETTIPVTYTNGVKTNDDCRCQILTAYKTSAVASVNPATFGTIPAGRIFAITIGVRPAACDAPTITAASLDDGYVNSGYNELISATGGTAPYTFAVTAGTLPDGVTLSAGGVLTGMATTAGAFTFTITATDSLTCASAGEGFATTINAQVPVVTRSTPHFDSRNTTSWN